jgi:hypothetical protein
MSQEVVNYTVLLAVAFSAEEIETLKRSPMFAAALERVTGQHEFKALCLMGGALLAPKSEVRPTPH